MSAAADGTGGEWASRMPSLSADGRYAVFSSESNNLVEDDVTDIDIFLKDLTTGEITKVTHPDGSGELGLSYNPDISADGAFVAFNSSANLVPDTTNTRQDVFLYEVATGEITLVSRSGDGGPTDDHSWFPSISADGSVVAYESDATNVLDGDDNEDTDVFATDVRTGVTTLVSRTPDGRAGNGRSQEPSVSGSGRYVAFTSDASDLADDDPVANRQVFVHDRRTGQTVRASSTPGGETPDSDSWSADISSNGRYVAYASGASDLVTGDTNGRADVFRTSLRSGRTVLVTQSPDGGFIDDGGSYDPSTSANGRYVTFISNSEDILPDVTIWDYTVFLRDVAAGKTRLVSKHHDGSATYLGASDPQLAGRYVIFTTDDPIAEKDTNARDDVYRYRFN